ncbi:MAG: dethiobiotin synthase [Cyclobacteriaceae bacterium]
MMNYFVTAIGTDSGKTLTSAILCEALHADYWKPIQAGLPRDTDVVKNLISNKSTVFHPEAHLLNTAASPHAAARIDKINIKCHNIRIPKTENTLVIEGAGGCLVPLNDEELVIDLIDLFEAKVILVSNHYLGSINHTLLTVEAIQKRNLSVKGIIFNGTRNEESERIILKHSKMKCLLRIDKELVISKEIIQKYAALLNRNWND